MVFANETDAAILAARQRRQDKKIATLRCGGGQTPVHQLIPGNFLPLGDSTNSDEIYSWMIAG